MQRNVQQRQGYDSYAGPGMNSIPDMAFEEDNHFIEKIFPPYFLLVAGIKNKFLKEQHSIQKLTRTYPG